MLFADLGSISDWLIKAGVGALAGGFIVNEINRRIAAASEQRRNLGQALSYLLTMHYDLSTGKHALRWIESMAKEMNTPPADFAAYMEPLLKQQLKKIYDLAQEASFQEAVTALAGIKPVLADELRRSKNMIMGPVASSPQGKETIDDLGLVHLNWGLAEEHGLEALQTAILSLAMKHGWRTLFQTARVLRHRNSVGSNPEVADMMKTVFDELKKKAQEKQSAESGTARE